MRRFAYLMLAALFASPTAAVAASWVDIGRDSGGVVWYADLEATRTSGDYRYVWVKRDHSADATVSYRKALAQVKIDCRSWKLSTLSVITYAANGQVVNEISNPDYSSGIGMDPIAPETMGEAIAQAVCNS